MSETISCPACGSSNEAGRKFCGECGTALAQTCPSCGTPNAPSVKFCGECGTALGATTAPAAVAPVTSAPAAERRLVSILFADIVGHTAFSEDRDAEDVRELLSRYFEAARTVIERYGGTVEKFIGDAVMAVWGTPIAQEDDAERAVRAALDLLAAVSALGSEVGAPELRARAGVLTGEAAVTLGAEGQGMVAGDLVNTASRIQSAADPGTVLVGEATKRSTEAAIVFEDAGSHALKGKAEPIELWQAVPGRQPRRRSGEVQRSRAAVRRTRSRAAARQGALPRHRGRPPVASRLGRRDRRYRKVAPLLGVREVRRRAGRRRLVALADAASRTATALRSGRCPTWSAGRAGIVEDEETATAREKLRAAVEKHIPDPQERRFAEPRLAHLLGLEEGAVGDQENLFAAARMFFERLARDRPDGTRVRGHPLGRQRAARLHRVPRRVVARRAALRAHALATRPPGPPPHLGLGKAQLHLHLPRAAVDRSDGGTA